MKLEHAGFEVLTAVVMNTYISWDVPFPKIDLKTAPLGDPTV
jgi:hypothetical protein